MRRAPAFLFLLGCAAPAGESAQGANAAGCPGGTERDGDVCRPLLVLDCPEGSTFREGVGCVAIVAAEPTATTRPPASDPTGAARPTSTPTTPTPAPERSATTQHPPPVVENPVLLPCGCAPGDQMCLMQCGPRPLPVNPARPTRDFDRATASHGLIGAARAAQVCRRIPGPTGPGKVKLVFQPGGTVKTATIDPPYDGTPTGECVLKLFVQVTVPPFEGEPVAVAKTFRID